MSPTRAADLLMPGLRRALRGRVRGAPRIEPSTSPQRAGMKFRTIVLALALILLAVFALLNWPAFVAPAALTLGFMQVEAPLGLIMLVVTAVVSGLFVVYIVLQQTGQLLEMRRLDRELRSERELADQAEASRIKALQDFVAGEFSAARTSLQAQDERWSGRIGELERLLRDRSEERRVGKECRSRW